MRKTKKCSATAMANILGEGLVIRTCDLGRDHDPDVPHHDHRGNWTSAAGGGA